MNYLQRAEELKKQLEKKILNWKIHTPNFTQDIIANLRKDGTGIVKRLLEIFNRTLFEIGERAEKLDDPILNELMCRLTIYTIADPNHKDYNIDALEEIRIEAIKQKAKDLLKEIKENGCGKMFNRKVEMIRGTYKGEWKCLARVKCPECQEAIKILEDILK